MENLRKTKKGVALLVSLSSVLLISLVVTESVQKTSTELKLIENEDVRLRLETSSFSLMNVFFKELNARGANRIHRFLNSVGNAGLLPDEETVLQNVKVWSMDHYIFTGGSYVGDAGFKQVKLMKKTLDIYAQDTPNKELLYDELLGNLADFIDFNDEPINDNNLLGAESHPESAIRFAVKNKGLDLISELNILPVFQEMKLIKKTADLYQLPFRIRKKNSLGDLPDCKIGPLNLNMIPGNGAKKAEKFLVDYMEIGEGLRTSDPVPQAGCDYALLYEERNVIAEEIGKILFDENAAPFQEPFKTPLRDDEGWKDVLATANLTDGGFTQLEGFFTTRSELVGLSYQLVHRKLTKTVVLHCALTYEGNETVPRKISVIYYKVS